MRYFTSQQSFAALFAMCAQEEGGWALLYCSSSRVAYFTHTRAAGARHFWQFRHDQRDSLYEQQNKCEPCPYCRVARRRRRRRVF